MFDVQELADKYVAGWNEADAERRRQQIAALWVPEGQHYVDVRKAVGYAVLEQRNGSHSKRATEAGAATRGFEVLRVDAEGRILADYQVTV